MVARTSSIFSTHPGLFFFNFLEVAIIIWWLAKGSLSSYDWIVDNECHNPEWQDTVWDGYDDAVKAATAAYGYLMEIRPSIQYSRRRNQLSARQTRTLAIFETIYGRTIFEPVDANYRQVSAQAFRRFEKILDIVIKIATLNDDEPDARAHYHMYCDDDMFVPFMIDAQGHDWFRDTRPVEDGGGGLITFPATCADEVMSYSWSLAPGRHYQTVYCADWVENWNFYGALSAYRNSRGLSVRVLRGTVHITQIALSFMAPAVLHELAHSPHILGNQALTDISCHDLGGSNFRYSDGYGWPCITWLAQMHPQQAVKNADSFAYLVTALYLDYADWRDGLGLRD